MPIKIPNDLPAAKILAEENIFVMQEDRAETQDIRPLKILLLNLMPKKIETETQFSRLLGNTSLQVELELIHTKSHIAKNVAEEHLLAFYKTFDEIKDNNYDGFIITGAPVEHLEFEEVEYWDELVKIMEWSKTHVHSTLHICWGAQAGLYYHFGIKKKQPWFYVLYTSVLVVNIGYLLLAMAKTLDAALWANRIAYLGSVFLPLSMLKSIQKISKLNHPKWLNGMLIGISAVVFFIAASPGWLDIYYKWSDAPRRKQSNQNVHR